MATSEVFAKFLLLLFCHLRYLWTYPKISPDWPPQLFFLVLYSVIPAEEKLLPECGLCSAERWNGHMPWILPTYSGLILVHCRGGRDLTVLLPWLPGDRLLMDLAEVVMQWPGHHLAEWCWTAKPCHCQLVTPPRDGVLRSASPHMGQQGLWDLRKGVLQATTKRGWRTLCKHPV